MSVTLDPTLPADSESPRQGASRIRALTLEVLQLLSQGGGGAVTFSAAPFSVDTSGNVTIPTTIVVPTPTASGQAATKAYVDGFACNTPSQTTTLANTTIAVNTNKTLFTLASTPPGTTGLYRALVSCTVYFQAASTGALNDYTSLLCSLSDSASLFTTKISAEASSPGQAQPTISVSFCGVSNATRTHNAGSVTFTVTGYNPSGSNATVNLKNNADADVNSKSYLRVAWIPAQ